MPVPGTAVPEATSSYVGFRAYSTKAYDRTWVAFSMGQECDSQVSYVQKTISTNNSSHYKLGLKLFPLTRY